MLCVLVCFSTFGSVVGYSAYSGAISEEEAYNAMTGTDKLIKNVMPMLTGKELRATVNDMLYADESLSSFLVNLYSSMSQNESELSLVGIDCTTTNLAICLKSYPSVSNALLNCDSWANVDLSGAKWGVDDNQTFADALSAILSPFNDVLYMLLCSGRYEMGNLVSINGSNGYSNAIVPMLESLGCTDLPSQAMFTLNAQNDKSTMIKTIVLPILNVVDYIVQSPAEHSAEILPGFAYFVDSGEFEKCLNSLLSPITSNPLVEIAVFLKIFDIDSLTNIDINSLLSSLIPAGEGSLILAPVDFSALAACGSKTDSGFVANKPAAYVEILKWIVDTLKLNSDSLGQLLGDNSEMLVSLKDKNTDDIVKLIILLFNPTEPTGAEAMIYPEFKPGSIENTTELTDKNLEKVYKEIDGLLDDFVKEGGSYSNMSSLISSSLYTNQNVNSLIIGIYKTLEDEGLASALKILGMDTSPKGVALRLTEWGYSDARDVLNSADSWADVNAKSLYWGFKNGSRRGFQNALTASLRPITPLLRVVLAEGELVVLDSITIKGSDGYNTAVIPVLEALGCSSYSIRSYSSYKALSQGDGVIDGVLEPVFDLLDDVADKPVQTLIDKLPNIVYFAESGSLDKCINNLLLPITSIFNQVPGVFEFKLDTTVLTKELDINNLASGIIKGSGIKIAEFDIKEIASLGTAVKKHSKSVVDDENPEYTYIEADRNAIVLYLLKIVAKTIKLPGNENLLMGSVGGGGAANFDASSMTAQFENMSDDEFVGWLYNLFFKERIKVEVVTGEDYSPTIIYTPKEKSKVPIIAVAAYTSLCLVVGVIILINRKRLYK